MRVPLLARVGPWTCKAPALFAGALGLGPGIIAIYLTTTIGTRALGPMTDIPIWRLGPDLRVNMWLGACLMITIGFVSIIAGVFAWLTTAICSLLAFERLGDGRWE